MNCCVKNVLHINLHILYIILVKTSSKIQELQKSNKYIKSYQQNKFEFLEKYWIVPRTMHLFCIYLHYISFALHLHFIYILHSSRNRYICITFH